MPNEQTPEQRSDLNAASERALRHGWTYRGLLLRELCKMDRDAGRAIRASYGPSGSRLAPTLQQLDQAQQQLREARRGLADVSDNDDVAGALGHAVTLLDELVLVLRAASEDYPEDEGGWQAAQRALASLETAQRRLGGVRVGLANSTSPKGLDRAHRTDRSTAA